MLTAPRRPEINKNTIKLLIGLIALFLASVTSFFADCELPSISYSYHTEARDYLVGFLYAITAFMLAYNGDNTADMILSKIAAIAAFGVAMFPCSCGTDYVEKLPHVHYISATLMFTVLLYFCYVFYIRALQKGHTQALRRAKVYLLCGITIVISMTLLILDFIGGNFISAKVPRLVFYCERAGLIAFGVSWLTSSKILPVLSSSHERLRPLS